MSSTVADIVDRLGPALLVGTTGSVDATVADLVTTDPAFPTMIAAGALVVAAGYRLGEEQFSELVAEASAAGAAGIVVKDRSTPKPNRCDLAVLVIEPNADWGHVLALLRTATALNSPTVHPEDSLFGLAEAIASMCGGPVVLHDPAWQLLAYSGGQPMDEVRNESILGRRAPTRALDELRAAGVLDRLDRGEVVTLADQEVPGLGRRIAVAARAGAEVLATIWLQPTEIEPPADIEERLRRAGEVAALTLLRHAAFGLGGNSVGDAAFTALLAGGRTERIVAEQLGVDGDGGFVLAGLRPTTTDARDRAATARRLLSLARGHCDAYRVTAQAAVGVDTAYLVFACAGGEQRQHAVRVVTDMHARLQTSAPHRAMVSSTYRSLAETPSVRQTVDELLELSERRGWSGLTDSDDVDASWRLQQFREVALAHPALLSGPIVRLAEHDRTQGTEFVTTMRAYFDNGGDVKAAGVKLGLHHNTVRYRVAKAQEIGRFSLDRPDERLLAELQVRLLT